MIFILQNFEIIELIINIIIYYILKKENNYLEIKKIFNYSIF